ncbi:hypothetical protein N665_1166s0027 [Sinapis alba]|nr:hypothetical protein N665_1166s0027 [Sinapis alba]
MVTIEQPIIPGLPDDLALRCIAKLSHGYHGALECVSRRWRDLVRSEDYYSCYKAKNGWSGSWLFVFTETDRWHPLPRNIAVQDGWDHYGFECVCVSSCLLVIGDVMRFNPFKKEWKMVASMRTPRARFACATVSGKVYVFWRWEELPAMPRPQMYCSGFGLSYEGSFHVLSDQVGIAEQISTQVFNPLEMIWSTVVMKDDRLYMIVDWGKRLIMTRDANEGEWYNVGPVPCVVVLPNHPREPLVLGHGFAALRDELYVIGSQVLKLEELGAERFDTVTLSVVRRPKPMCIPAGGAIIGCVSLEESSPP